MRLNLRRPDFDVFIKENWPGEVPTDCTKLDKTESDCIERGEDGKRLCKSCRMYVRLCRVFEKQSKANQAISGANAKDVARQFCIVLHKWLGKDMRKVILRNRREKSEYVCHSGDFCDSNMAMDEAFKKVTGFHASDASQDAYTSLWNKAWDMAKKSEFMPDDVGKKSNCKLE